MDIHAFGAGLRSHFPSGGVAFLLASGVCTFYTSQLITSSKFIILIIAVELVICHLEDKIVTPALSPRRMYSLTYQFGII